MKTSRYNYFVPYKNDAVIAFNGITKDFFSIAKDDYPAYLELISNPDICKKDFPNFHGILIKYGFIVDDNFDEYKSIKEKYFETIQEKTYTLIIFPTYQCNFSCWYCVQRHENEYMSKSTISDIKKHIEKYVITNNITHLELSWFGGEPLLYFNECITDISLFTIKFCKENGIEFTNGITTNGYLLDDRIINQMKTMEITSFQITIDGDREKHNSVRNENGCPSFDKILDNIVKILQIIPDAHMTLRFNYTADNVDFKIISDLNDCIPSEYRKYIKILFRKVWQIDERSIDSTLVEMIQSKLRNSGYLIRSVDINMNYKSCYAENIHYNTIFHDGSVDKCGNINFKEAKGKLNDNGDIIWKTTHEYYNNNIFTKKNKCQKCKYLPICMGPCPLCRERNDYSCGHINPQESHEFSIIEYYEMMTNEN